MLCVWTRVSVRVRMRAHARVGVPRTDAQDSQTDLLSSECICVFVCACACACACGFVCISVDACMLYSVQISISILGLHWVFAMASPQCKDELELLLELAIGAKTFEQVQKDALKH